MPKEITTGTVKIERNNINLVKSVIIGTEYTIASFYAEAAREKIDRDNLRSWLENPINLRHESTHNDAV